MYLLLFSIGGGGSEMFGFGLLGAALDLILWALRAFVCTVVAVSTWRWLKRRGWA